MKRRRALLGSDVVTVRLSTEHGRKTFTTKYFAQGLRFETALRAQLKRRKDG
jgi:hypothetical protein